MSDVSSNASTIPFIPLNAANASPYAMDNAIENVMDNVMADAVDDNAYDAIEYVVDGPVDNVTADYVADDLVTDYVDDAMEDAISIPFEMREVIDIPEIGEMNDVVGLNLNIDDIFNFIAHENFPPPPPLSVRPIAPNSPAFYMPGSPPQFFNGASLPLIPEREASPDYYAPAEPQFFNGATSPLGFEREASPEYHAPAEPQFINGVTVPNNNNYLNQQQLLAYEEFIPHTPPPAYETLFNDDEQPLVHVVVPMQPDILQDDVVVQMNRDYFERFMEFSKVVDERWNRWVLFNLYINSLEQGLNAPELLNAAIEMEF